MKNETENSIPEFKNSWQHEISERAQTMEQTIQNLITENPVEAIVVAMGIGLVASKIFGALQNKKDAQKSSGALNVKAIVQPRTEGLHS